MSKKGGRRGHLTKSLYSHSQNIQETFQMLDKPASSSLDKVDWPDVVKLGDEVSKQATIAGMLWNGEPREVKELEENMEAYFNMLQGFLLTCHGSTVNAGPTLHERIHSSAKQVVDSSLSLLKEAVSIYDSGEPSKRLIIPQLAGSVWEACTALKKTPTTNCTAIVRAITLVAVSVKDVLREMKELKTESNTDVNDQEEEMDDALSDDGLGDDLSAEEMIIAQLVINVTYTSLNALKEVIQFLSGLLKNPNVELDKKDSVDLLERLLGYCKEIGSQVSELGACVYPPQEISDMKMIAKKIAHGVGEIRGDVERIESSNEKLFVAFQALETALGKLDGLDGDLEFEMHRLALK
ncbi:uncharacterized protein A4U43_C05F7960 [Asparagus officinalis]|uniref:Uncharacterized protein n=1 Tax=Asparagus officinalis TaxID=4686 RepID=A0A5P1ETU5_ASPOF|nr:uncharacterized protein LOC109843239 [Asparagus officinalis]ONK68149.1 uncharacterized protein A4U43_C05F7960 [Asparagus officinalis]